MQKLIELITLEVQAAFKSAGFDESAGKVNVSNRPDLCEYQCNGAMALAKQLKTAPIQIANAVVEKLSGNATFSKVEAVMPGFINLNLSEEFLADYVRKMASSPKFGMEEPAKPLKIVIDYGGPNVAKALHVGHLRPAVVGEAVKRICKYNGHDIIGDVHLGDWGLPMGLVIYELQTRKPDLPYFDDNFTGDYPKEPPFTVGDLEEMYPTASKKSKEDADYKAKAMEATVKLQSGVRGYRALWDHIINVSVNDMKRIYDKLDVNFDLWNGESSVHEVIPGMVQYLKDGGYAYLSEGALVVDVKEETDTKEVPPCIILKSDGASLYNTTDCATIMERTKEYDPDMMIYVTDKRQDLYFEQVFRCAHKTGLSKPATKLCHIGLGTMNGKDGKPFKTRDGGVMRLEYLLRDVCDEMYKKIKENKEISDEEAENTAKIVGLSALKYGDLSNQPAKDYIFDMERFTSFEGNTGPYILYTIVRIKSILEKYKAEGGTIDYSKIHTPASKSEKDLMNAITFFGPSVENAYNELAPNRVCAFIYDLANALNSFYHETKILTETDADKKAGYIALIDLTRRMLETCIDMLGFSAPERM
ncbi:MAG: arginine--tRNA ligase [Lachnospiraceae bacterium]|nr:arginine--tRNA ligase [Lachnospiraceae bacterium]